MFHVLNLQFVSPPPLPFPLLSPLFHPSLLSLLFIALIFFLRSPLPPSPFFLPSSLFSSRFLLHSLLSSVSFLPSLLSLLFPLPFSLLLYIPLFLSPPLPFFWILFPPRPFFTSPISPFSSSPFLFFPILFFVTLSVRHSLHCAFVHPASGTFR